MTLYSGAAKCLSRAHTVCLLAMIVSSENRKAFQAITVLIQKGLTPRLGAAPHSAVTLDGPQMMQFPLQEIALRQGAL